jgi:hypothetical protein
MITVAAAWYLKWQVNRSLRPEAMGGLVHLHQTGVKPDYPIHPSLAASGVLDELFELNEQNNKRRVSEQHTILRACSSMHSVLSVLQHTRVLLSVHCTVIEAVLLLLLLLTVQAAVQRACTLLPRC